MNDDSQEFDELASFFLQRPNSDVDTLSVLKDGFTSTTPDFSSFHMMSATVSDAGVSKIQNELKSFCENGGEVEIFIGLGLHPSPDSILELRKMQFEFPDQFSIYLVEAEGKANLFHPKVYWFHDSEADLAIVGSSNWSDSAFTDSIEASAVLKSFGTDETEPRFAKQIDQAFQELRSGNQKDWITLYPPTDELLSKLEKEASASPPTDDLIDIDLSDISSRKESLWPLYDDEPLLVMEIIGESRGTQVVPTKELWDTFFGIDADKLDEEDPDLPVYELTNVKTGEPITRPVVDHDHQGTLDIPELKNRNGLGKDFIIFLKNSPKEYVYDLILEDERPKTAEEIEEFISNHGYKTGTKRRAYKNV